MENVLYCKNNILYSWAEKVSGGQKESREVLEGRPF
jgi:hypothetical protein